MKNDYKIETGKTLFNPLYEHGSPEAAKQKNEEWLTFARTHPDLMDELINMPENELEAFRQLIEAFSVREVIDMIRKFAVMKDVANDKLDIKSLFSDEPGEADPNIGDEK